MPADKKQSTTTTIAAMGISTTSVGESTHRFCWAILFFILVDSFSKWLEVKPMSTATSTTTIDCLHSIFSTHGLPEVFVSDNGAQFTSAEFKASWTRMEFATYAQHHTTQQPMGWQNKLFNCSNTAWRRTMKVTLQPGSPDSFSDIVERPTQRQECRQQSSC